LGTTYRKLENYTKAQKIYKEGFLLFPESEILPRHQAVCALLQNDTSSANHYITLYRTALTNQIVFPESLVTAYVGRIYESAGRIEKAEEFLRLALEMRLNQGPDLDRRNPGNNLFWYYEALGTLLIDNDINVEEGIEKNQIAMDLSKEIYPESHSQILYGQGSGYFKQGKYEESLQALRLAEEKTSLYDHKLHQRIQEVEAALADQNR
jgi:tetratricopeptide (TPR) repeat protein